MMHERGLTLYHVTDLRRVQLNEPEINRRMRPHVRMGGASSRLDETYVKAVKKSKYLYRGVDSTGNTIEFMPSAKRDVSAARRFLRKMMKAEQGRLPLSISVGKNAACPEAFGTT
jgi:transposase-like protein